MPKCANCELDAKYIHKTTPNPATDLYFCQKDLPRFLFEQAKAGLLNLPVVSTPAPTSSKKKKDEVEPEALSEPDIVE